MNTLFDRPRRGGKTLASDLSTIEELKKGNAVVFVGITTEQEAKKVYDRLLNNHGIKTVYKPTLKTRRPRPVYDMNDPETPIVGYDYFPAEIAGYEFTI